MSSPLWNGHWIWFCIAEVSMFFFSWNRNQWLSCSWHFPLSLSSVCVVLPRAPPPSSGGAGPVWPDAWGPAGQVEATTSDIFRNLQWGQCDWLCCLHKGTKGTTRHFIMSRITVGPHCPRWGLLWVVLCCHLLEKWYNAPQSNFYAHMYQSW